MNRLAAAVLLLALLGVAGCGEDKTAQPDPSAEDVIGIYRVDANEATRAFLSALQITEDEFEAERKADPEKGLPLTLDRKEAWVAATRERAAAYASVLRLELGEAGHGNVTFPAAPENEPHTTRFRWTLKEAGIRVQPDSSAFRSEYRIQHTEGGLRLSNWIVFVPSPGSDGKYARDIWVNLALKKH